MQCRCIGISNKLSSLGRIGLNNIQCHTTHIHWVPRRFFLEVRVNRVNSWVKLVQTTSKVILPISAEFQGDFPGSKRVIRATIWLFLCNIFLEWGLWTNFKETSKLPKPHARIRRRYITAFKGEDGFVKLYTYFRKIVLVAMPLQ